MHFCLRSVFTFRLLRFWQLINEEVVLSTGIQLKDLIALHTAVTDMVNGNLINVQKMVRLATIVSPLLRVHITQPPVNPNMELIKMLRVSKMMQFTFFVPVIHMI